ncbi:MAG: 4-hydroxy-3-methylbut-2-enyl diphosphate reductase [Pseudomonadota bacterium]|nr:4-hydroxy-3-methylbut-2-enyl diphosphate reductase [Pseudomonadota bacterium]
MTDTDFHILLVSPRGFCAGVDRAVRIVERTIERYGAPVYVRHQIVHNPIVVADLEKKGAVFVRSHIEAKTDRPLIFSAHGTPLSVHNAAKNTGFDVIDAVCPLVQKVHNQAVRLGEEGRTVILVGHAGHPEVIGTMGQLPKGVVQLVTCQKDVDELTVPDPGRIAHITQTTLSIRDTQGIIARLKTRFPAIVAPKTSDICYATTNRQKAVAATAARIDLMIVVGGRKSSNSNRLIETAQDCGAPRALLIETAAELTKADVSDARIIGITAGASTPERSVRDVIERLGNLGTVTTEEISVCRENVAFRLPERLA